MQAELPELRLRVLRGQRGVTRVLQHSHWPVVGVGPHGLCVQAGG